MDSDRPVSAVCICISTFTVNLVNHSVDFYKRRERKYGLILKKKHGTLVKIFFPAKISFYFTSKTHIMAAKFNCNLAISGMQLAVSTL